MKIELVRHTTEPDLICGQSAAICTGYEGDPIKALRGALRSGHESVAEHAAFTFMVEGVSRVTLAQLTRHRIASYSVQSQRYCGADPDSIVIPDSIVSEDTVDMLVEYKRAVTALYDLLISRGVPAEDARYILPQGITTTLTVTLNARELRHFFSLRCCNRAQWEIRQMADEMLRLCKEVAPVLFDGAGAGCVRGKCPEGAKSCGKPRGGAGA